jgi:23S rRNA (adenine2030-N6)-methyltransferase
LCALLRHLSKKPKPFCVVDTHAGSGLYRLDSVEATRTGEADEGIKRVIDASAPALQDYLALVRSFNSETLTSYPGSPAIIRELLRDYDRLIACESEPAPVSRLRSLTDGDPRIAVHQRDGFAALNAFLPPKERRGLIFMDPPFESPDEFDNAAGTLNAVIRKWPTGIYALWYPIKGRSEITRFRRMLDLADVPTLCVEFLAFAKRREGLTGSGLIIFNPPWQFDRDARAICKSLVSVFETGGSSFALEWWTRAS